ncbi:DUF4406 domain-containing protein [Streptococcus acidominimus]|uniref:DUF7768 domain-containing protein n=1 Tax=Streptococcus acidominimus TaxID=1326 RepID=UPI001FD2B246|nr:DUF4406 domain-containing protein [Streptococcus acidominimus]
MEENQKKARSYSRQAIHKGCVPIAPHLLLTQFLDDHNPDERIVGLTMGQELLKRCDEIWVFGPKISDGMKFEIDTAKRLGKSFRLFHEDGQPIVPRTMEIDDRVNFRFASVCGGHDVIYAGERASKQPTPTKKSPWSFFTSMLLD